MVITHCDTCYKDKEKKLGGPDLELLVREGFPEEATHELRSCVGYLYYITNEPSG